MRDDDKELVQQFMKTRYDFAAAVMAYHKPSSDDDALFDRMNECERAYLAFIIKQVSPGFAAAFARHERDMDQLRKLVAMPPEGKA